MRDAYVALGSNVGDSAATLQGALDVLEATEGITVTSASRVFETDPVGGPDQDVYLNAVVAVRTSLHARELLAATQAVENSFGRVREVHWGPRTLDVDILTLGDEVSDDPQVTLPHPRAHERGFVLVPWADVDASAVVPGVGAVSHLLTTVDVSGVRATDVRLRLPGVSS